jgi:hypothetical protein
MKKVFYFMFCSKRIVFCKDCLSLFDCSKKTSVSAQKCSRCGRSDDDVFVPICNGTSSSNAATIKESAARAALKKFCFEWYIKVGFNLKKACSSALLRQHSLLDAKKEGNEGLCCYQINLSQSTKKSGVEKMQNILDRSRLRNRFADVVESCRSGSLMLQQKLLSSSTALHIQMLQLIVMAESMNRVVAECDVLKTGCSGHENFPNIGSTLSSTKSLKRKRKSSKTKHATPLMIAAIEGNLDKASAYIVKADLDYISHQYHDASRCGGCVASCALHLALERGNTDIANVIIDRIHALASEEYFDWYPDPKLSKQLFLDRLFLGANPESSEHFVVGYIQEIPTAFMYLARHAMIHAMDKFLQILRNLKKAEEMQQGICTYMVKPKDSNGLNALHYAVFSQSPKCVEWFIPFMHDFHVCDSSSKLTFVPDFFRVSTNNFEVMKNSFGENSKVPFQFGENSKVPFQFGYPQLLRMHPPSDVSDSDRRLSISEDWIQTYCHACHGRHPSKPTNGSDQSAEKEHLELSPYELALLVWCLADSESALLEDNLLNIATNPSSNSNSKHEGESERSEANGHTHGNQVSPEPHCHFDTSESESEEEDNLPPKLSETGPSEAASEESSTLQSERLAQAYKQRSDSLYHILTTLERAAEAEAGIDAKKKKGLKQLSDYRSHRAMSRLVFPGVSYLIYVIFATLMAIIMTNGLFDEPTKFTSSLFAELGGKEKVQIKTYSDLTTFWKTLAGVLWSSSPMARTFGETQRAPPSAELMNRTDYCVGSNI